MKVENPHLFQGLSDRELSEALGLLEHRKFPAGSTVIAEGDTLREIYAIQSGQADIFITNRDGMPHHLNRVGAGTTLGEMSFFTGQPTSATVVASNDLDIIVMNESDFHRTAALFPRIYYNLGAILSERLAQTNVLSLGASQAKIAILEDRGSPPLLGYALACSAAWHMRAPVLLLYLTAGEPPEVLSDLAGDALHFNESTNGRSRSRGPRGQSRAYMVFERPEGAFAPTEIQRTLDMIGPTYGLVLVQTRGEIPILRSAKHVRLCASDESLPSMTGTLEGRTLRAWVPTARHRPDSQGVLAIPALIRHEVDSLRNGLLSTDHDAGRTLGWSARDLTGLKVGIAFGAGGAKGYAHLGVLDVLERAGVAADYVAGTSIGSGVGSMWANGFSLEKISATLDDVGAGTFRFAIPGSSLLSNSGLRSGLKRACGEHLRIEDLPVPTAVIAADIVTESEVIFRTGILWQALLASMSVPGIYPPQRMGPYVLVDGGIINPVPSSVVDRMGADTIISIKLAHRSPQMVEHVESVEAAGKTPSVFHTIIHSIDIMQSKIITETAAAATIVLEPLLNATVAEPRLRNFKLGRQYIEMGIASAEEALPRIQAALPWLRPEMDAR